MTGDLDVLARQAVMLRVLADRVSAEQKRVKGELEQELAVGGRWPAALDDGTQVGAVTYAKGRVTAKITDQAALLAHVQDNYPQEIVKTVRDSFITHLLDLAKQGGIGIDPQSGEILPFVEVSFSDPVVSVKPDPGKVAELLEAVRANHGLALDGAS